MVTKFRKRKWLNTCVSTACKIFERTPFRGPGRTRTADLLVRRQWDQNSNGPIKCSIGDEEAILLSTGCILCRHRR